MAKPKVPDSEHAIQNKIRNALAGKCLLFRANVGKGWQGEGKPFRATTKMTVVMNPGDLLLRNARPFDAGPPPGFPDTFGMVSEIITPDMVGLVIARFIAPEIKDDEGRVSPQQANCIAAINHAGGKAGVCRSVDDAFMLIFGVNYDDYRGN